MSSLILSVEAVVNKLMPAAKDVYRSFNVWWLFVGCISLYGFVFLKLPAISASGFFHALMILAFIVSVVKAPRSVKKDQAWYLIAAAIIISLFIYFWSNIFFPEYAEKHPSTAKLLTLCQFLPIAWWLGGETKNVLRLLFAAVAGLFVWLITHGLWEGFAAGIAGKRVDFGLRNAQHTAMFFSVAFMGWLIFIKRIVGDGGGREKAVRALLWSLGAVVLGIGIIITQTRTAWFGVAVSLLFVIFVALVHRRFSLKQVMTGGGAAIILSVVLIYPMSNMISARLGVENEVMYQLYEGDIEKVPYSSIGIRIHLWLEAWKWIKQRPVTGWGYNVRERVFAESETLPKEIAESYGHFHNSYIEILLSYGIIGILFVSSIFYIIARQTWVTWRSGKMPTDMFLFGLAFFIFWMLVNMTESYFIERTGVYLMGLIGGCLYTFSLSERQKLKISGDQ